MSILKKRSILKLAATFMLVAMMAGAFAIHSPTARADSCTALTFAQGACDTTVASSFGGNIEFSNDATIATTRVNVGSATPFTFDTMVKDLRTGTAGTWSLQAVSPGLTIGGAGTPIPLLIGGTTTPTTVCTDVPTCPTVSSALSTPTDITTVQTFASAVDGGHDTPHGGTVTVTTPGSYTFATNTPAGSYSGTITISLTVGP
ncbi:MAG TPA: hypothetical protein VEL31_02935 [Ktedonobacteraceae bacterium]|nr:hypothetical protein [Ktedonobacteraceae bacterium]